MQRLCLLPLLATLALPQAALSDSRPDWDQTPRIAVVTAFAPEWQAMTQALDDQGITTQSTVINQTEFLTGQIGTQPVVIYMSGVSMVNAAMTTQLALDRYNIDSIIFSGIAGSADPQLNIGDVIIPDRWAQYLEMALARETDEGFSPPPFLKTDHPNFGMIFPMDVELPQAGENAAGRQFWFDVPARMIQAAQTTGDRIKLESCNAQAQCLTQAPKLVVGGNGLSASAFMDNAALREWAHDSFDAQVFDMESAAVAHVAAVNDVDFIAVRSVSDLAGGGDGENEMAVFMDLAAQNSVQVVMDLIAAVSEQDRP